MPDVGKIVTALMQASDGLRDGKMATAQADKRALDIQVRATRSGFRGIAEGMGQVRAGLKRLLEMEASIGTALASAGEIVQRVTKDMSPGEVVSTLSPVIQRADATSSTVGAVNAEVDRLKANVAAVLRGGQPAPTIALLDQIKQAVQRVSAHLGDAKQRTEETISEARQTGNF